MANYLLTLKYRDTYVSTKRIVKMMPSLYLCGMCGTDYLRTGTKKGYNKETNFVPHNLSCKLEHFIIQNPRNIHTVKEDKKKGQIK